jgi:hypothetical protein
LQTIANLVYKAITAAPVIHLGLACEILESFIVASIRSASEAFEK